MSGAVGNDTNRRAKVKFGEAGVASSSFMDAMACDSGPLRGCHSVWCGAEQRLSLAPQGCTGSRHGTQPRGGIDALLLYVPDPRPASRFGWLRCELDVRISSGRAGLSSQVLQTSGQSMFLLALGNLATELCSDNSNAAAAMRRKLASRCCPALETPCQGKDGRSPDFQLDRGPRSWPRDRPVGLLQLGYPHISHRVPVWVLRISSPVSWARLSRCKCSSCKLAFLIDHCASGLVHWTERGGGSYV